MTSPAKESSESVGDKVDGALTLFGKIQIWIGIVVGVLLVLLSGFGFVGSFFWDTHFQRLDADVATVVCGSPTKQTRCTTTGDTRKCTTETLTTCDLGLQYALDGKKYAETLKGVSFQEGHEPSAKDKLAVYVDGTDPNVVKMPDDPDLITPHKRTMIRIVSAIVFVVALGAVVFNVAFRRNRDYQRIQGTFGAIDAVGDLFGSH